MKSSDCCQGGYQPKRARWFHEWPTSGTRRKNRAEKEEREGALKRNEREQDRDRMREKESGREKEGETIVGCGGGRFTLKFKYHSRGRALTLRSVEHSGPIWIHYNVFASSPGPVIPSIRIMPPHFNTTGQRNNDASKLFRNEDIRISNNWLACLAYNLK